MFKSCVVCNVFFKYCKILTEDKKICEQTCGPMLNPIKNVVFFNSY